MYNRLLENDEDAISELWTFFYKMSITLWANHRTVSFFREDYVSMGVMRVLEVLHTFEGRSSFNTWAVNIFKNVVLDQIRYQKHRTSHNDEVVNFDEFDESWLRIKDDNLLVNQLFDLAVPDVVSETNFHILVDYVALGRTAEEVCLDYGLKNANTLHARVFRTKKKILEAFPDFLIRH